MANLYIYICHLTNVSSCGTAQCQTYSRMTLSSSVLSHSGKAAVIPPSLY